LPAMCAAMPPANDLRFEIGACLRLALPLIIGQIGLVGLEVTDIVMAGHLHGVALAAVGLGASLAVPLMIFFMGVCMAVSPIVAFYVGARDNARIAPYLVQTLWLALLLGVCWWLLYQFVAPLLLALVAAQSTFETLAVGYIRAMSWGAPGACVMFVVRFMFEGMGRARPVMLVGLAGLLINALANYLFMYGVFGLPAMGAVGA